MTSLRPLELADGAAVLANAKAVRERLRNISVPIFASARADQVTAPKQVGDYIATVVATPAQTPLEIVRRAAVALASELNIDPQEICIILPEHLRKTSLNGLFTMASIQAAVAAGYGVTIHEMMSRRRHNSIVEPRHVAMTLCKHLTYRSTPEIGNFFGGRDHTTILSALKKYEDVVKRAGETIPENASLPQWVEAVKRTIALGALP